VREFGRAVGILVAIAAVGAGSLYVALPPNETAAQGPADPIRKVRRPVVRFLRKLGIGEGERFDVWHRYRQVASSEYRRAPVYRGLFWRVGDRVSLRYSEDAGRVVRLCYVERGRTLVAAEAAGGEVSGFIPREATAFWTETTDGNGTVHTIDGWGDVAGFCPD
jgi:hypothetical protein